MEIESKVIFYIWRKCVVNTKDKILLFIPGYNCEKQIVRVLEQLDEGILSLFN